MNDLISVIIPIYDVEQYLDECIESVTQQTYRNLEIILIDDGSPDNCPKMCDEWAKKDERIKVIHKENGGLSSARNAGLDICTGDYISFVDSDDYIHKNMYATLLKDIKEKDVDIVKCGKYFDRDGEIEKCNSSGAKIFQHPEILENYFYYKEDFNSGCWDKLYKAALFDNVRFPEGINSEDYFMYIKVYSKVKKIYFNSIPLYYYRIRQGSICRKKQIHDHSYDKIIISDMVKQYVIQNIPERVDDATAFQFITRFGIYYVLLHKEHTKQDEKDWKRDLKKFFKDVLGNKKVSKGFQLKYFALTFCPHLYLEIKKFIGYKNPLEE